MVGAVDFFGEDGDVFVELEAVAVAGVDVELHEVDALAGFGVPGFAVVGLLGVEDFDDAAADDDGGEEEGVDGGEAGVDEVLEHGGEEMMNDEVRMMKEMRGGRVKEGIR